MSKPRIMGRFNSRRDSANKERIHWERQKARKEVAMHDPTLRRMLWGAVDEGCLLSAVTAGMKKKGVRQ